MHALPSGATNWGLLHIIVIPLTHVTHGRVLGIFKPSKVWAACRQQQAAWATMGTPITSSTQRPCTSTWGTSLKLGFPASARQLDPGTSVLYLELSALRPPQALHRQMCGVHACTQMRTLLLAVWLCPSSAEALHPPRTAHLSHSHCRSSPAA